MRENEVIIEVKREREGKRGKKKHERRRDTKSNF